MNFLGLVKIFKKSCLALSLFPVFILFSCGEEIPALNNNNELSSRTTQLDILVIGDGSSAGFNTRNLTVSPGFKREDKEVIEGQSFAAFFASFLNQTAPKIVNSFENISLVGISVLDWIGLLNPNQLTEFRSEEVRQGLSFVTKLNKSLGVKGVLEEEGLFELEPNPQPKLAITNRIKRANLIFISLGFVDILKSLIPIFKRIVYFVKDRLEGRELIQSISLPGIVKSVEEASGYLLGNLTYLLRTIKLLNPKAEIVLLSYPFTTLNALTNIFDVIIKRFTSEWRGSFFTRFSEILNNTLANAASQLKVNFVNLHTPFYAYQDLNLEKPFLSDITNLLPTKIGQELLAKQLLLKLTVDPQLLNKVIRDENDELVINQYLSWLDLDKNLSPLLYEELLEYIRQDSGRFKQLIKLSPQELKFLKRLLSTKNLEINSKDSKSTAKSNKSDNLIDSSLKVARLRQLFNIPFTELFFNTLAATFSYLDWAEEERGIAELKSLTREFLEGLIRIIELLKDPELVRDALILEIVRLRESLFLILRRLSDLSKRGS